MRLGSFELRPGWLPTLVTVVLLAFLSGLGVWQLERAQTKRELLAQWRHQKDAAPRPLAKVLAGKAPRFTPVTARGRFDGGHQFLLDNRIRGNRPGFEVLTPLRLAGGGAILVNRGWVPMGRGRSDLPEVPVPEGPVEITGHLAPPPSTGIRLGAADPGRGRWPKIIQYMDAERMAGQVGYPVKARVIRLDPSAGPGFDRDWGPPVRFGPERHEGYAAQWFALAVALLVIYIAVNTKRRANADGVASDDE
ncbi:MAG TPA: SURF1 family protein [Gammaproteobacteria bacterium]|nr:SURF1 family protein [Gammaproteobacteria bacterium]